MRHATSAIAKAAVMLASMAALRPQNAEGGTLTSDDCVCPTPTELLMFCRSNEPAGCTTYQGNCILTDYGGICFMSVECVYNC
jgi:hypothetical protein